MTFTIANGATASDAKELNGQDLLALLMPAAFTGITLKFQVSQDNVTFVDFCLDTGAAYSMTVAASKAITPDFLKTRGLAMFQWVKVVSGSAEGGARSIIAVTGRR